MSGFDDELRQALRARARHLTPPADPIDGVRTRARRIRRRRAAIAASVTGVGVVVVAVGAPLLVRQLAVEHAGTSAARPGVTAAASHGARGPSARSSAAGAVPLSSAPSGSPSARPYPASPPPVPPGSPDNVLRWPPRGVRPSPAFDRAAHRWLAVHTRERGGDPSRADVRVLWSGPIPRGRWARLGQVWNPTDPRYEHAWSTLLLVGRPNGAGVDDPYDAPTRFMHQSPGQSVPKTMNDVKRIAGYAFGFNGYILVVGSPKAESVLLSVDGRHVTDQASLSTGAAILRYRRAPEKTTLVQIRGAHGQVLTPKDLAAARAGEKFEGWHPDTPPR